MKKCVDCLFLDYESRDYSGHKCRCSKKSYNFVSPRDPICNEFIKNYKTLIEKERLLNDTEYFSLLDFIFGTDNSNDKEEIVDKPIVINNQELPAFLETLLRYAGYSKNSNMYNTFLNIMNIIRRYDSDYFLKALDDEYYSIIQLRFGISFFNDDYRTVAKKIIDNTNNMQLAYHNNNYQLLYKEWLIFLKYLYNLFIMDKYMNKETKNMIMSKFKK